MSDPLVQAAAGALFVGRYRARGEDHFLPVGRVEIERVARGVLRLLRTFDFAPGRTILFLTSSDEGAMAAPLVRAAEMARLVPTYCENSIYDAARVEKVVSRFDPVAVMGLGHATLSGLEQLGCAIEPLFSGRAIWARPDAYPALASIAPPPMHWLPLGPALALECDARSGAHLDSLEWRADCESGTVTLDSRLPRQLGFTRFETGIRAAIDTAPCACGSLDPRVLPHADA
jgi:hypothetical protein